MIKLKEIAEQRNYNNIKFLKLVGEILDLKEINTLDYEVDEYEYQKIIKYIKKLEKENIKQLNDLFKPVISDIKIEIKEEIEPLNLMGNYKKLENLLRQYYKNMDRENMIAISLNQDLDVIGVHNISIGSEDRTVASASSIFKPLVLTGAKHFIIVHNHPLTKYIPSNADYETRDALLISSKILGIDFFDFIVVDGKGKIFSFLEHDIMRLYSRYNFTTKKPILVRNKPELDINYIYEHLLFI
ncbi:JAB domain-containing protein [Marinitoga litoralis]|uniref:JAB domain-containing protein n=1 Tax=Marinitoga litoralis TaxID=570855 RepID=UPI00195F96E3|nr:JAB domain-containing protein [Marinitoga litoralis]MBM7560472.1 DNA repair protein RadC [Marinitoga litoralis]